MPRPERLCSSPFPDCSSRRVSKAAEHSSAGIDVFDDSLQLLECSPHSESSLCDLPALDHTATVAHTPDQSKCSLALKRATVLTHCMRKATYVPNCNYNVPLAHAESHLRAQTRITYFLLTLC